MVSRQDTSLESPSLQFIPSYCRTDTQEIANNSIQVSAYNGPTLVFHGDAKSLLTIILNRRQAEMIPLFAMSARSTSLSTWRHFRSRDTAMTSFVGLLVVTDRVTRFQTTREVRWTRQNC